MTTHAQLDSAPHPSWDSPAASVPNVAEQPSKERFLVVDTSTKRRIFRLNGRVSLSIGRNPRCRVMLDDPCCSRVHCKLVLMHDHWLLVHLSRTNATLVNGTPIDSMCHLHDGDVIRVGRTQLSFWVLAPTHHSIGDDSVA